jgi:hypothetical protein
LLRTDLLIRKIKQLLLINEVMKASEVAYKTRPLGNLSKLNGINSITKAFHRHCEALYGQ